MKGIGRAAFAAVAVLLTALQSAATTVKPLLLDEVVDAAAIAFHGTCVANRVEIDPQTRLVVTLTTFEVREPIKGAVASTHVIKQIGGTLPGGDSGLIVHGVPKFGIGQEYVLFLAGVSTLGFSSPVGLAQGRFEVSEKSAGKVVATGRPVRALTARMTKHPESGMDDTTREIALDEFKALVRAHVGRQ
jgi:hypothetical protein